MADVFQQMDMVSSGECAIEKLQQQTYDLILMDIDMPGLNGIEATTWIRHGHQPEQHHHLEKHQLETVLLQNRRTPIVAVTTNMSLEWKKTYLKVGMNGCISKPISPYVLRHSLSQVLMYGSHWDYSDS
ncbi:CheY-like superfamily [Absidia repens]|uniref:CheY-like superfamily n=1 Tax=Absidia repens TaxID=90262 RepID=A0A1X2IUY3_9FUNG|nr:CheY-like superfamily [Absidia repens]